MLFNIDLRNKNVSEYHLSVVNNSNVDTVKIFSQFVNYQDYSIYLKVESDNGEYVDKIAIEQGDISIVKDALVVKWTLGEVSTRFKKINIQLQFEKDDEVAQSNIVSIVLNDTIDVNKGLKRLYPCVLTRLEQQVAELTREVEELKHKGD